MGDNAASSAPSDAANDHSPAPPAADGRRLRWAQHRAERRAAFVDAGVLAVDSHGPEASAEQIAAAAGVSRTVLYRYFRDREDLRTAIADQVARAVIETVLPQLQLTLASTPRQVIAAAIGSIVSWLDEHPNLYHFLRGRRSGASLDSIETTLADQVAALLKTLLMFFGIDADNAEPNAYGIVGFVESSGSWWLQHRTMSRAGFTDFVCAGVWHLLEGTVRDHGVTVGYDSPLPNAALTGELR